MNFEDIERVVKRDASGFVKTVESEAEVILISHEGFADITEATLLWCCIQYATAKGKSVHIA